MKRLMVFVFALVLIAGCATSDTTLRQSRMRLERANANMAQIDSALQSTTKGETR